MIVNRIEKNFLAQVYDRFPEFDGYLAVLIPFHALHKQKTAGFFPYFTKMES